ncbi:MAG: hypothetical protein H6865_07490 [Rhodospirillales bacterium]|nr:hypothetical protein [Alphaproteobacteria bacterium]MCB9987457.1 hypothetical protein [Rhodospirillales bacterium]USO07564.1 MAG: hypothetical protein H6866_09165 [Rhodospirillales bacterium]
MVRLVLFSLVFFGLVSVASASEPCPGFVNSMRTVENALATHDRSTMQATYTRALGRADIARLSPVERQQVRRTIANRIFTRPANAIAIGRISLPTE